jgi:hypothetical protein
MGANYVDSGGLGRVRSNGGEMKIWRRIRLDLSRSGENGDKSVKAPN